MTIKEALLDSRFISGELWARSVLWRDAGWAMRILGKSAMLGYGATVSRAMDEHLDTYTSEWELIEPAVAIEARRLAEETDS